MKRMYCRKKSLLLHCVKYTSTNLKEVISFLNEFEFSFRIKGKKIILSHNNLAIRVGTWIVIEPYDDEYIRYRAILYPNFLFNALFDCIKN